MRRYTQKMLKELVLYGLATDISQWDDDTLYKLHGGIDKSIIGYSHGVNGLNGVHFEDLTTGQHYVVVGRNNALMIMG